MADELNDAGREKDKIRVGTAIIKNLSTSFYPNPKMIFDELMTNSRDAMATTVSLQIGSEEIVSEDDGEGMNQDELLHFFYIAYSSKPMEPIKKRGKLTREIIGRFGIGKLSLYQICRFFEITSWKDGKESRASFDFDEFEKKAFVDDFSLKIESTSSTNHPNGTRIVLKELKQRINARDIKRHLVLTMPLSGDFKIRISGVGLVGVAELKTEDVLQDNVQRKFKIDEFVEKVGQVTGVIYYKKKTEMKDFGVFIRVFGRLVNTNDPYSVINFANLTSAQQFDRRIYVDLNVNGLNEALQTNRAGFVVDHPAYQGFVTWLKKTLNKYNQEVGKEWKEEREEIDKEIVKDTLMRFSTKASESQRNAKRESKNTKVSTSITTKPKDKSPQVEDSTELFVIDGRAYEIDVIELGEDFPEAQLDKKKGKIVINSSHPSYLISRSQGGVWGVQYHAIRAAMVLVALESSKTLSEFKRKYDRLALDSHEIVSNMRRRLTK